MVGYVRSTNIIEFTIALLPTHVVKKPQAVYTVGKMVAYV